MEGSNGYLFINRKRLETIRGNFGVDPVVFITITITITIAITITTITITITIAITITTILTKGAWLHVDASYAGSAFICPEFRHLMKGVKNKKPEHIFSKVAKRVPLYFLGTFSDRVRPELQHEPKQVDAGQL